MWRSTKTANSFTFKEAKNELNKIEDFGVEETETLSHFQKPKPPGNRRKPVLCKSPNKQQQQNSSNCNEEKVELREKFQDKIVEETPKLDEILEEVVLRKSSQVIQELSRSLSSTSARKSMLRKTESQNSVKLRSDKIISVTSLENNTTEIVRNSGRKSSELFTQRMLSCEENDGIENPTSL
jgi:hypothetical protein